MNLNSLSGILSGGHVTLSGLSVSDFPANGEQNFVESDSNSFSSLYRVFAADSLQFAWLVAAQLFVNPDVISGTQPSHLLITTKDLTSHFPLHTDRGAHLIFGGFIG